MNANKLLTLDLEEVKLYFPKLGFFVKDKKYYLKGDLDICDSSGVYWDTFKVGIAIPEDYPYGVPLVLEISEKIPRESSRHISKDGLCCVDIDHELLYLARRGLKLVDFIRDKVYPFFANQLYFEENDGKYANGEYKHNFHGVRQFYSERLSLTEPAICVQFLERLVANNLPKRNDPCLCSSGKKYKRCHEEKMEFLKSVGMEKLKADLDQFRKSLPNSAGDNT